MKELGRYVQENSSVQMETQMLTRYMEQEIIESKSEEDFFLFMDRNVENFRQCGRRRATISANI